MNQLIHLLESWNERFFLTYDHQVILTEEFSCSDPNQTNLAVYLMDAFPPDHYPFQTVNERFGPVPDELIKIDLLLLPRHSFETENRVSIVPSENKSPDRFMARPRSPSSSSDQTGSGGRFILI